MFQVFSHALLGAEDAPEELGGSATRATQVVPDEPLVEDEPEDADDDTQEEKAEIQKLLRSGTTLSLSL